MKDISVITITWNSAAYIADQIRSVICAGAGVSLQQIIVDNASADETQSIIRREFPEALLIVNKKNRGFAAANNQAWRFAQGEFILFLNPDMRLSPGSLDRWVAWVREQRAVGISGCLLTDVKGRISDSVAPRRFPTVWNLLAIFLKLPHFFPHFLDHYQMRKIDWSKEQIVDSVQGSCMLVRRELLEKLDRAFDERYFIWFEDVDLCREAKRLGYKVMYTPIVSCVDYGGQSFRQRNVLWKQALFFHSAVKYFCKWKIGNRIKFTSAISE